MSKDKINVNPDGSFYKTGPRMDKAIKEVKAFQAKQHAEFLKQISK